MHRPSSAALTLALVALAACSNDTLGVVAPEASSPSSAQRAPSAAVAATAAAVPGQYIVVFKRGVAGGLQKAQQKAAGGQVVFTYSSVVNGFAAKLGPLAVAALKADPDVLLVEPDPIVSVGATQSNAIWGLDRIDQAALPLNTTYTYANTGAGVTVYIVDTGMNLSHVEFGGRAVAGFDAVTAGGSSADCHGHGTHVGGTVGGATYGVAKGVRLVAVRVLDCGGQGTGSGILAGLDWIVAQKQASPSTPMVVNMSLTGGAAQVLDDAVAGLVNAGISAVVAAGNSYTDACTMSPARLPQAITVGATDRYDAWPSWSNRGPCVDLAAPGVSIVSAGHTSTTALVGMSGTSMATPHVAGAAALYLNAHPAATPAQVASALVDNASVGRIVGPPASTANRLLNISFLAPAAPPPPPPTVVVSPKTATIQAGQTAALSAAIGNPVAGGSLTWQSKNPAIVTVAASGATTATASGVAAGTAYVVAVYTAGATTVRDSAAVTVTSPPPPPPPPPPTGTTTGPLVSAAGIGCIGTWSGSFPSWFTQVAACAPGAASQRWTTPAVGVAGMVTHSGGLCLSLSGAGPVGTVAYLGTCSPSSPTQRWTYTAAGELRSSSGFCAAASPYYGSHTIRLETCAGTPTQRWTR